MSEFLNNLYKAYNFQLYQPVVFFDSSQEPKNKKDWLYRITVRPLSLKKLVISRNMKYYYSQAKFIEDIQVYPQGFVKVELNKRRNIAKDIPNVLEKSKFLEDQQPKFCIQDIGSMSQAAYWSLQRKKIFKTLNGAANRHNNVYKCKNNRLNQDNILIH